MMKVGCAGFPIGQDRYWKSLSFVEARTGEIMPREETLTRWRQEAPKEAEFSVQAYRLLTHSREDRGFPPAGKKLTSHRQLQCGWFRDTLETYEAWNATKAAVDLLGARTIIFETPSSFLPGPDRVRDLNRFFKALPRRGRTEGLTYVWHPRSPAWDAKMCEKICGDLGLVRAYDPFKEKGPLRGLRYLRPTGPKTGGFKPEQLALLRQLLESGPTYLVLSHRDSFYDAEGLSRGLST
jgi:uncharacterized protein YecE (DUF72 family)